MKHIAAIFAIVALTGCATLSEDECLAGNWQAIGFEDGAQGQPPDRVGAHREACERYGVTPNLSLWRAGYDQGLDSYCTRDNGFRVGATGAAYHGVCQGARGSEFLIAYRDGSQVYELRSALDHAQSDLYAIDQDIDDAREARDRARKDADTPGISAEQRDEYLDEAERLSEEIGDLSRQRIDVEYTADQLQGDLWDLESEMRKFYPAWSGL